MQQRDDDIEKLGADLDRMLQALPQERSPRFSLEQSIAQQLIARRLLVSGEQTAAVRSVQKRIAVPWPAAAAAAAVLFVSGVLVGASAGRSGASRHKSPDIASGVVPDAQLLRQGDLLLAADKDRPVTRAIKF